MSFCHIWSILPDLEEDGVLIRTEIDISRGFHSLVIVGMGDRSLKEAKERVSSAIKNSGYEHPKQFNNKITVSLSPAVIKKEGSIFDLPIAIAFLKAKEVIRIDLDDTVFFGELTLDGKIKGVKGLFPALFKAKNSGFKKAYIPSANYSEYIVFNGLEVIPVSDLSECVSYLTHNKQYKRSVHPLASQIIPNTTDEDSADFVNILGNTFAKQAMKIAVLGRHNIAIEGPAGTGKTMLSKATASIVPDMTYDEYISCLKINSFTKSINNVSNRPPFVSPHHSSSYGSIIGGGNGNPGAITLAHNGILFMDEFPEFDRRVIESLREPMEDKKINISRVNFNKVFPANFMLIASMNPCQCGNYGSKNKKCICTSKNLTDYRKKISGPIVDRFHMWLNISEVDYEKMVYKSNISESSSKIREQITIARKFLLSREIEMSKGAKDVLVEASTKGLISARSINNIESVARSICAFDLEETIHEKHILQALQYRKKEL